MAPFDATTDTRLPSEHAAARWAGDRRRIAVIGAGAAGLGAAWALDRHFNVVLYESADRPGGHANTVDVRFDGHSQPVDTGFIVYNEVTYPNMVRLFAALDVATEASDMSFAVSMDDGDFEYAGSPAGLLARRANLVDARIYRMARDIVRFYGEAPSLLRGTDDATTLGEYVTRKGYSKAFVDRHLIPMGAAIWSCTARQMLDFPAKSFVRFCHNHGLLKLLDRPQWRTVSRGSREYVARIVGGLKNPVRLGTAVTGIVRGPSGVLVRDARGGVERYDEVVLAGHADQSLAVLGDRATARERTVLGAFGYSANRAVLHSDPSLMPRRRAAWASWNYIEEGGSSAARSLCVTYWMNRLQNIDPAYPLFVTLNPFRDPDRRLVHREFTYHHPQFDAAALAAQKQLPALQGVHRTWFCGSYCGFGFHEDALQSGLAVAEALGAPAPWAQEITPVSPAAGVVHGDAIAAE